MKLKIIILSCTSIIVIGIAAAMFLPGKKASYLSVLKRAGKYNPSDHRDIPAFTYQPADDPNLVTLRKTYHLDSIAGKGDQVSQVLNLMYWLHNRIHHNGNLGNPPVRNALSLLAVCKKENRTLNCRGLAIVLNDCYLSMGFKSRFLTCLPKDSLNDDNDCHNINMVYITSLKKWIWVDPTVAGYVEDDKGILLGPGEVRNRLIDNKTVNLNPDANWNHRKAKTNQNYLYTYMAKNLYRFECPASSEFDLETAKPGKVINYVELYPLDYFRQQADNKTIATSKSKVTYIDYATNNPAAFWAAPVN